MEESSPIAFLSYVSFDDEHESGCLNQFRERLTGEIDMQTGQRFPILYDRRSPAWIRAWQARVEEADDPEVFLIAIITPRYFQDTHCRSDLQTFLRRERRLGRNDLIHPIYYVRCPQLDGDARTSRDDLARAIVTHEYTDWRELRFEPADSPDVGRALEALAVQIRDALAHSRASPLSPLEVVSRVTGIQMPRIRSRSALSDDSLDQTDFVQTSITPEEPVEPGEVEVEATIPVRVVDPMGRGGFVTISGALLGADPGDRILVRPGVYEEELVMDRPLEIIGDGNTGDVVVQAKGSNAILFRAGMGRVANLTLRQLGGGNWFCVKAIRGKLILENCDIASESLACVGICQGADPELKGNRIHGSKERGILVYDHGRGILEDNDIFGNGLSGVEITSGASPTLRSNRIYENQEAGVYVYNEGQGTLEENEIYRNSRAGMRVSNTGKPILRNNHIHKNAIVAATTPLKGGGRVEPR